MVQLCVALPLICGLFADQSESSVKVVESFVEYHSSNEDFTEGARSGIADFSNRDKIEAGALTPFLRDLYPDFADALRVAGMILEKASRHWT